MSTGFGATSWGITPFGFGTPDSTQAPPDTVPTDSRFINFRTKDYETAANGELKRMPNIRHRVLISLSTTLGSSTVLPKLGLKLPDRIDSRYPRLAELAIRAALSDMVVAGEIKINFINVIRDTTNQSRVDHVVAYTDLTTGNSDTVNV